MATTTVSVAGRKDKSSPMKKQPVAKVKVRNDNDEEDKVMATTPKKKVATGVLASAPTGATREKIKAEKQAAKPQGKATAAKPATTSKSAAQAKPATTAKPEAAAKPAVKAAPKKADASATKTLYHVSKRDNDGREWKVFIQGSNKVIKLFPTQQQALDYAKQLCANKDDGSMVYLHGLDGKIRKY